MNYKNNSVELENRIRRIEFEEYKNQFELIRYRDKNFLKTMK
jgi:hypothetical protein